MWLSRIQQSGLLDEQSKSSERQSNAAVALDSLSASHRRLEITSVNEPAQLRRDILQALEEASKNGSGEVEAALKSMSAHLTALISNFNVLSREYRVVESLSFTMISERQRRITEAHPRTYDWLFEEASIKAPGSPGLSILDWLRTGKGIYWVSGKAGSGKSTLMKYLYNHDNTLTALCTWADKKQLVTAGHFFWYAGTDMQKSQQGLLQTLLYNVLRQNPALVPLLCKSRWEAPRESHVFDPYWSLPELLNTFSRLATQSVSSANFCFFVDGLDEYEGDHTEVIRMLNKLASNDDIKVCFSSRPWNVFEKGYGDNHGKKLELENLTQGDIRKFVKEELFDDPRFQELKSRDARYDGLVKEIAYKACGVFLWVVLVVRSLRRGLTNEDTILELQERLRVLPTDLEEFFRRMLDSVEGLYHRQAARLYLMRFDHPGILSTMTVSYFDEEDPEFALRAPMAPWSLDEIRERCTRIRVRVMARCTDLLVVSQVSKDGELADSRVDFLHRTVHDFFQTRNIHSLLTERAGATFNTHLFMCNSTLSQIKRLELRYKSHDKRFDVLLDNFMYHFSQMEIRGSYKHGVIVDELDQTISNFRKTFPSKYDPQTYAPINVSARYPETWLITEAMKRRLYGFLSDSPDKLKTLIKKRCPDGLPPLHVALESYNDEEADYRIVSLLLNQGASPNSSVGTVGLGTIWDSYLQKMYSGERTLTGEERRTRVAIIEELLLHGADPGVDHFRNKMSCFATAEEVAHLEDVRLGKLSENTPLYQIRQWLPWIGFNTSFES